MPVLPTPYTAPAGESPIFGGRRAAAEDFGQGFGEAGAKIQHAARGILADAEESEARKALVASSEIRAKYAKALDEAAINGSDTAAIKEQMLNDLGKVGEGFSTKKGVSALQLYTANANLMFDQEANRINVQRAVSDARLQADKFKKDESASVVRSPSALANSERLAEEFAATFTRIPPATRAEIAKSIRQELNQAAAWAYVKSNPADTKTRLEGGEWDLTREAREQLIDKADSEIRGQRADKELQRHEAERKEHAIVDTARGKFLDDIIRGKTNWATIRDSAELNGMQTPAGISAATNAKKELYLFMEHRNKEMQGGAVKSNPAFERNLVLGILAADGAPNKITNNKILIEGVNKGLLSTDDALRYNQLIANMRDENYRTIGAQIGSVVRDVSRKFAASPQGLMFDAGQQNAIANDYNARIQDRVNELRNTEGANVREIFDPKSPNSVVTPEFFKQSVDRVKQEALSRAPKIPDLRVTPDASGINVGDTFIDPRGQQRKMTEALQKALRDTNRASGGEADFKAWLAATGGVLKPGQTQEQAILEWKRSR